jgi:YwiC-like protein
MTSDPIFLLPREHGAYGQLSFPLVTSVAVAGLSVPALCLALAVIAGFLAHEPLLVLLGRRGARAKRDQHRVASLGFIVTTIGGALAALAAVVLAPAPVRWAFLLPLAPAALLAVAIAIQHEKRALGEVSAALAFSFVAVPLCLTSGASLREGLSIAIAFAAIAVTATMAVRVVVLRVRGGGNPRAERMARIVVLVVSGACLTGLGWAGRDGILPWAALAAATPGVISSVWLALVPPPATRLRVVGWTLVAVSAVAAVVLIAGLRV